MQTCTQILRLSLSSPLAKLARLTISFRIDFCRESTKTLKELPRKLHKLDARTGDSYLSRSFNYIRVTKKISSARKRSWCMLSDAQSFSLSMNFSQERREGKHLHNLQRIQIQNFSSNHQSFVNPTHAWGPIYRRGPLASHYRNIPYTNMSNHKVLQARGIKHLMLQFRRQIQEESCFSIEELDSP